MGHQRDLTPCFCSRYCGAPFRLDDIIDDEISINDITFGFFRGNKKDSLLGMKILWDDGLLD